MSLTEDNRDTLGEELDEWFQGPIEDAPPWFLFVAIDAGFDSLDLGLYRWTESPDEYEDAYGAEFPTEYNAPQFRRMLEQQLDNANSDQVTVYMMAREAWLES